MSQGEKSNWRPSRLRKVTHHDRGKKFSIPGSHSVHLTTALFAMDPEVELPSNLHRPNLPVFRTALNYSVCL